MRQRRARKVGIAWQISPGVKPAGEKKGLVLPVNAPAGDTFE
jgi:hypothetical protein